MKLIKVDVVTNATGNGRIGTRGTVLNVRQEEGGNGSDHYANRGHGNGNGQYHHKPETSPLGNGEGGESMLTEAQQWAARQRLAREQHDDGRLNVVNGGGGSSMKKLRKMDEHGNTPSPMGKKRSSAAMARRAARAATSGV